MYIGTKSDAKNAEKELRIRIIDGKVRFPFKSNFLQWITLCDQIVSTGYTIQNDIDIPSTPALGYKWEYLNNANICIILEHIGVRASEKLADIYTEKQRLSAKYKHKRSPLEEWRFPCMARQIAEKAVEYSINDGYQCLNIASFRDAIYKVLHECGQFKITIMTALIDMFGGKRVFDPYAGWGERMLGTMLGGADTYIGVDPNKKLKNPYDRMIKDLSKYLNKNCDCTLIIDSILNINIDDLNIRNTMDIVIASPPFYDYEIYDQYDDNQSIVGYENREDWIEGFLIPSIIIAIHTLRQNGKFILHISDSGYLKDFWVHIVIDKIVELKILKYDGVMGAVKATLDPLARYRIIQPRRLWIFTKV